MPTFLKIPDDVLQSTNAEEIVSFLKSVQVNQKVRLVLLTKFKSLSEEWTGCIAVREQHSWSLKYDGCSDCEIDANFDDEDEENSVLFVNNWLLGWCSFDNRSASKTVKLLKFQLIGVISSWEEIS